jgi:beta-lactam-binding protein with PASTA domain
MTPVAAGEVQVTLHSPSGEWLVDPQFTVVAGGKAEFRVRVRNNSGVVDHFTVSLDGVPKEWCTVTPDRVFLMPYGSGGDCEQDVIVTISTERVAEAVAGPSPFRVVVASRERRAARARIAATLHIEPFVALDMKVWPPQRSARRRGRFHVQVRNNGNSAARVVVEARDESEGARLKHGDRGMTVPAGGETECTMTVRPKRPILLGQAVPRPIEVAARAGDDPPVARRVEFRQLPWLPRWAPAVVLVLAAVLAAVLFLREPVPDVRGLPVDAARRELDKSHLDWLPPELRRSRAPVGTVIETIPAAGTDKWRGSDVTLIVATNEARAAVPDVRDKTYAEATLTLLEAGFRATGRPPGGDTEAKVAEQVPAPGARVSRKRAVALTFATPDGAKQPKDEQNRPAAKVTVPSVAGQSAAEAVAALRAAGLKPTTRHQISDKAAGAVLGTRPATGELPPGSPVEVLVSAGFPDIAYDDGEAVYLASGVDGRRRRRLDLAGSDLRTQPSWTPDGQRLVYRAGTVDQGRIYVSDPTAGTPSGGRPLTEAGYDDRRPAVAPDGKLVAFVRASERAAGHRLCLVGIGGGDVNCLPAVAAGLTRPTWSPQGTSLLVRSGTGTLMHFKRRRGSSAWRNVGSLPLDQLGDVRFVAWSRQDTLALAVVAPRGQPALYRADGLDLATLTPIQFAGAACELAWRSDGEELVVAARVDDQGRSCPDVLQSDPGAVTRLAPDGAAPVGLASRMINPIYRPIGG